MEREPQSLKDRETARMQLRREVRERITGYIAGALSLVAGLAWNDAVKGIIEYALPLEKNSIPAKVLYAIVISFVAIVLTIYLVRLINPPVEKK